MNFHLANSPDYRKGCGVWGDGGWGWGAGGEVGERWGSKVRGLRGKWKEGLRLSMIKQAPFTSWHISLKTEIRGSLTLGLDIKMWE